MADFWKEGQAKQFLFYPSILAVRATLSYPFVSVYSIYLWNILNHWPFPFF
uniref:Uncharacterized protein n=1 Tax=Amphimedon queenslandica TaxID=400682 RepID=A0A1X7UKB1_AMPQE